MKKTRSVNVRYIFIFLHSCQMTKIIFQCFLIIVGFLMWAIAASVATPLVLLKKWLSKKCCNNMDEESNDESQQTPHIPNPIYSPGQLSLVPLMVMHTLPSSITSTPSSITSTPEIEDQEEEEPVGQRTRCLCAKRLNLSKTSVV